MICYKITIYCDNVDCEHQDEAETNDGFDKLKSFFKDEGWKKLDGGRIFCPACVHKMNQTEDKNHPKAKLNEQ